MKDLFDIVPDDGNDLLQNLFDKARTLDGILYGTPNTLKIVESSQKEHCGGEENVEFFHVRLLDRSISMAPGRCGGDEDFPIGGHVNVCCKRLREDLQSRSLITRHPLAGLYHPVQRRTIPDSLCLFRLPKTPEEQQLLWEGVVLAAYRALRESDTI